VQSKSISASNSAHVCLTYVYSTHYSIRSTGETKFVALVALVALVAVVAIVAIVADVLGIGWVSLKLCSNILRNFYLPFISRIQ
jgi:hypothetical protein